LITSAYGEVEKLGFTVVIEKFVIQKKTLFCVGLQIRWCVQANQQEVIIWIVRNKEMWVSISTMQLFSGSTWMKFYGYV
jgi:hypothetical protein